MNLLRLGAAQLCVIGVADHAAVDATVALAEGSALKPYRRLINAVLRRLARQGRAWRAELDAPRLDTPVWLWESWAAAYGEPATRAIATAHLKEPPLDLSCTADPARWEEALNAVLLPTGTLRRRAEAGHGPIEELAGYAEGAWWVQDLAAALPARLLGDVSGEMVLDLCAAPGGKTAQLAAAGAQVIALDRSAPRLARLAANLTRLGLSAQLVEADAAAYRPAAPMSRILLDAPCSATGTIRRHPDIARLKEPEDIAKLARAQARMLEAAIGMLAPGGTLVYTTCSLQPEEGVRQIETLLGRHDALARRPIAPGEIGDFEELISAEGDLASRPDMLGSIGGIDGFYAARLVRKP
jgi:16S rRNA (cytosine967-C5)-methyltransferase